MILEFHFINDPKPTEKILELENIAQNKSLVETSTRTIDSYISKNNRES